MCRGGASACADSETCVNLGGGSESSTSPLAQDKATESLVDRPTPSPQGRGSAPLESSWHDDGARRRTPDTRLALRSCSSSPDFGRNCSAMCSSASNTVTPSVSCSLSSRDGWLRGVRAEAPEPGGCDTSRHESTRRAAETGSWAISRSHVRAVSAQRAAQRAWESSIRGGLIAPLLAEPDRTASLLSSR